jgi:8-oxo-dGTP diphosphatase
MIMELQHFEAVKGLIKCNNRFLVLERKDYTGGKYEIPGGRKKHGESDEAALEREIMEESGLKVKLLHMLNSWSVDVPEKDMHLDGKTYLCESKSDQVQLSDEHTTFKWVTHEELAALDVPAWLREGVAKL